MPVNGANEQITKVVLTWEGVTARPHRRGGTEYMLGGREIGHVHGDDVVDVPFPKRVASQLVASGRAEPHERSAGSVSCHLVDSAAIERGTRLLRESFERLTQEKPRRRLRDLFRRR